MSRLQRYLLVLAILLPVKLTAADLIHQDISVRLDAVNQQLNASSQISRPDAAMQWPDEFMLARHARITGVFADGIAVPYEFLAGVLKVAAAESVSAMRIDYHVLFNDPVPEDRVGIEDPSYGVVATISPQGSYLAEASGWHPQPRKAKSLFTVRISGADGMTGVTAGRLVNYIVDDHETTLVWQTGLPQQALALAAGNYRMQRHDLEDIQLLVFVSDANAPLAEGYLESLRQYLLLYQELFGPYPYEKFAVVENFYPTGYGLPGWTLLGSSVVRLPFIKTTSLPHEIAHAWWGNAVEVDYSSGNWAEGLATYVADYYLKELSGPDEAVEYRRKLLRDYAALVTEGADMPLVEFRSRMSKRDQAIGYGKTAMVFHMLRELIGDNAFWQGLQNIALKGRGQRYGWVDLRRHFEEVSNINLESFFRQWTQRAGAPRLSLEDVEVIRLGEKWQVSGNLLQSEPVYELAIPLRLVAEGRIYEQSIGLSERQDCFVFTVDSLPRSLAVDPDSNLFRKLYAQELPATINDLRASRTPLVVVAAGAEGLREASRDLLRGLQWQNAEVVDEQTYLKNKPRGRDLLFLGWPQAESLQAELPGQVDDLLGPSLPNVKLVEDNRDVLFMVKKHNSEDRVSAYFLPGSLAAAQDSARRIPHYGRYSYLYFRDGRNLVKKTWEPGASPLKLTLD